MVYIIRSKSTQDQYRLCTRRGPQYMTGCKKQKQVIQYYYFNFVLYKNIYIKHC